MISIAFVILCLYSIQNVLSADDCSAANTYCVGTGEAYTDINTAIRAVTGPGDVVLIKEGTYPGVIHFDCCDCVDPLLKVESGSDEENVIEMRPFESDSVEIVVDSTDELAILYERCQFWLIHEGDGSLTFKADDSSIVGTSTDAMLIAINGGADSGPASGYFGPFTLDCDTDNCAGKYAIEISDVDPQGIILDGLTIQGKNGGGILGVFDDGGESPNYGKFSRVHVWNSRFFGVVDDGICFKNAYFSTIENNYFSISPDASDDFVFFHTDDSGGHDLKIQNNVFEITRNLTSNPTAVLFSLTPTTSISTISNIVIQNNLLECSLFSIERPLFTLAAGDIDDNTFDDVAIHNNLFRGSCGTSTSYESLQISASNCIGCSFVYNTAEGIGSSWADSSTDSWTWTDNYAGFFTSIMAGNSMKPYPYFQPMISHTELIGSEFYGVSPRYDLAGKKREFFADFHVGPIVPNDAACKGERSSLGTCDVCSAFVKDSIHFFDEINCDGSCEVNWEPVQDCSICVFTAAEHYDPNACDGSCVGNWGVEGDCSSCQLELKYDQKRCETDTCADGYIFEDSDCVPDPNVDDNDDDNDDDDSGNTNKTKTRPAKHRANAAAIVGSVIGGMVVCVICCAATAALLMYRDVVLQTAKKAIEISTGEKALELQLNDMEEEMSQNRSSSGEDEEEEGEDEKGDEKKEEEKKEEEESDEESEEEEEKKEEKKEEEEEEESDEESEEEEKEGETKV